LLTECARACPPVMPVGVGIRAPVMPVLPSTTKTKQATPFTLVPRKRRSGSKVL
jgi:hypothetical protein